ncbi:MAG TPA: hydroxyacid dehydrogenase [Candidatus Thermoplasmatota archaeon]|nr:hydroxyacid dehydrogenase [Candidatus Thermoplasmatota archaeon]
MRVLVSDPLAKEGVDALRAAGHDVEEKKLSPEELVAAIGDYEALVIRSETKVTRAVLEAAQRLKVVGRAGVGVDNVDLAAAKERGVAVVNAPLAATNAVAELTIGRMLDLARHLAPSDASMRQGEWQKKAFMGSELSGKTLGLVGVGRIGSRVAEIAKAFGMRVVFYDPYVPEGRGPGDRFTRVEDLVARADYVSLHVPLTPETKHLVNAKLLAQFRKGARLLNMSRGGIVDENALAEAVKSGHLAGAALDVFETEPLPKDSPLLGIREIRLAPHVGASTREAQDRAGRDVAEQVNKVLAGEKPDFRVA